MTQWRMLKPLSAVLCTLALCPFALAQEDEKAKEEEFPDFEMKEAFTKEPVTRADMEGRITFYVLWYSKDHDCELLLANIKKALANRSTTGIEVICFSVDDNVHEFRDFVFKQRLPYINFSENKAMRELWLGKVGLKGFPTTFLVGPGNRIAEVWVGSVLVMDLNKALDKVIADTPPTAKSSFVEHLVQKQVMKADDLADQGKVEEAIKLLEDPVRVYQGFPVGEELVAKYQTLRAGHFGKADMEAVAKLVKAKDFKTAMARYDAIAETYKGTDLAEEAAAEKKKLENSDAVKGSLASAEADKKAPGMIKNGRKLLEAGKPDAAKKHFESVIKKYPGTKYADEAKELLARCKE